MMKKKIIVFICAIAIIAICVGVYDILNSYLFDKDGKIIDSHEEMIEHLKNIEDDDERKKQIDYVLEQNLLTETEAEEIY